MVRLSRAHADIATSRFVRVPAMAATSMRGGVLALLMNLRQRARTDGERESVWRIVHSLGKLKGVAMKVGQHLSYADPTLPDDVCAALSALQTHSPPISVSRVTKILRGDRVDLAIDPEPIAAASIGQVHRATLPDGTRVAVKVQYPDIANAIATDFGPASVVARFARWVYPSIDVDAYLREARARALDECDYRAEARHQAELAAHYADHETIVIPHVHAAYCGDHVLTTTFVDGVHLDTWLARDASQEACEAIGLALVDFYAGSALRWGLVPGDPHPGNYVITPDGKLAIVDHGCTVRRSAESARRVFVEGEHVDDLLLLRVRTGIAAVLARLGVRRTWRELVDQVMTPRTFDVVLLAPGDRIIEIVREVRDLTGHSIHDAKQLVEHTPRVLGTALERKQAEALKQRLEASGGIVELVSSRAAS